MDIKEKSKLEAKYITYCNEHKIDLDLFDLEAEIDSTLNFYENWSIIEDKLRVLCENGTLLKQQYLNQKSRLKGNVSKNGRGVLFSLFNEPKMIGLVADTNEGKSNLLYYLIEEFRQNYSFKLFAYGFKYKIKGSIEVFTIERLEGISNSLIIIDEFYNLFNLEDRNYKMSIESTIRTLHHNNNIIVLSGLGENFKKFISAKLSAIIFKKVTFDDLINGSKVKRVILNYNGDEKGSSILNLEVNEAIVYDGLDYHKIDVPYMSDYDSKRENVNIFVVKNVEKR